MPKIAFKFRLWSNANQERELAIMRETHRRLYNRALAERQWFWDEWQISRPYQQQSAWLKSERLRNGYLARINFSSAQATLRRLDRSFQNFFRRVKAAEKPGYPRFKAQDRFESIEFPSYGDGIRLIGDRLRVQHVGTIRICLHRRLEGKIKTLTLKQEADKWYVIVVCEMPDYPALANINPPIGIDLGLGKFLATSDGEIVANPRFLKVALPALQRTSRAVSRKKLRGANRRKAVKTLRRAHARIANLRREHAHRVSNSFIARYGLIAIERLNIQGMVRNSRLSRAISDVGWSGFIAILKSKAARAAIEIREIDPKGTNQTCVCGASVPKTLRDRIHICPECGLTGDRDVVSAQVILQRALATAPGMGALSVIPAIAGLDKEAVYFS